MNIIDAVKSGKRFRRKSDNWAIENNYWYKFGKPYLYWLPKDQHTIDESDDCEDDDKLANGFTYEDVLADDWEVEEIPNAKKNYVIVRSYKAGVFAGFLESKIGQEVVLTNARRIWYWEGAASLSQLAMEGTSLPKKCKFPIAVDRVQLLEVIEILDVTQKAKLSIESVPVWKH